MNTPEDQSEWAAVLNRLLPCPFCGGSIFYINEAGKIWNGMKYTDPVSVSFVHWCPELPGQPSRAIERIGRDTEAAIAAWNMRATAEVHAAAQPDLALATQPEVISHHIRRNQGD